MGSLEWGDVQVESETFMQLHGPEVPEERATAASEPVSHEPLELEYWPLLPGIVDSATTAGGDPRHQDACFHLSLPGCKLMVVADGVGQFNFSTVISQFAVSAITGHVQQAVMSSGPPENAEDGKQLLLDAFSKTTTDLLQFNQGLRATHDAIGKSTILAALEVRDAFIVAGLGDGGSFHFSGDLTASNRIAVAREGRLDVFGDEESLTPRCVVIPKTNETGNIIIICTDGMKMQLRSDNPNHDGLSGTHLILPHLLEEIKQFYIGYRPPMSEMDDYKVEQDHKLYSVSPHRILESWVYDPQERITFVQTELIKQPSMRMVNAPDHRTIGVLADGEYVRYIMGLE